MRTLDERVSTATYKLPYYCLSLSHPVPKVATKFEAFSQESPPFQTQTRERYLNRREKGLKKEAKSTRLDIQETGINRTLQINPLFFIPVARVSKSRVGIPARKQDYPLRTVLSRTLAISKTIQQRDIRTVREKKREKREDREKRMKGGE